MINKSLQFSILLTLGIIFLAQVAYAPILFSSVLLIILGLLIWRYWKQMTGTLPKVWIILLLSASLAAIYFHYQTFIGVDAGVALLTAMLFAKALENKTPRDVIILFNFALFVSASLFLYSQSIAMALLILCALLSTLLGLYRLQLLQFQQQPLQISSLKTDLKHVLRLKAYALPFFILLFLFFPRLPPLWQIPVQQKQAVTGISDQMSPGDIARLSQSSALAFRIIADMQRLPPRSELYWRALVLDQYDGIRWTSSFINQQPQHHLMEQEVRVGIDYQYLPAEQQQIWVTALEKSLPLEPRFQLREDWGITALRQVQRTRPIALRWVGNARLLNQDGQFAALQEKINTAVPLQKDARARQFARRMFAQSQSDPQRYLQNILNWYRQQDFIYTLSPGRLGDNRIDEFLFQSRQGFCEHYASSFVMLMRYVGIPARVVVGYQGGQLAPDGQSWEVRQLDAHAWSEVRINGQWQRIDPTAMIAPQRIDQGMQNLLENDRQIFGGERLDHWKYQQFNLLKTFRVWGDYAGYQWQSKVLGYDHTSQQHWLSKLGLTSVYSLALILILSCFSLGVLYFLLIQWQQRQQVPVFERQMRSLDKKLPVDLRKQPSETFQHWMQRLADTVPEKQRMPFQRAAKLYQKVMFQELWEAKDDIQFGKVLKDCALVLKQARKNLSGK